jgi:hypothetical protein
VLHQKTEKQKRDENAAIISRPFFDQSDSALERFPYVMFKLGKFLNVICL